MLSKKTIFSWVIVILWMIFIFVLSSQVAIQSNELSYGLVDVLAGVLSRWFGMGVDVPCLNGVIRTLAHMFEYLVLGALVSRSIVATTLSFSLNSNSNPASAVTSQATSRTTAETISDSTSYPNSQTSLRSTSNSALRFSLQSTPSLTSKTTSSSNSFSNPLCNASSNYLSCKDPTIFNIPKWVWFTVILCVFYAVTDEFHQYFVPGRSAQWIDLLIDSVGVLCGVGLYSFLRWLPRRRVSLL